MEKLKKSDRELIMSNWRTCLTSMRVYKSMRLAKINGPLLVGLYLAERTGKELYSVEPHVHNLTDPCGFMTLTLSYPLRNKHDTDWDSFSRKSHDIEFPAACKRLHAQTLFPLQDDLSLSQILRAYEVYIEQKISFITKSLYIDPICYLTWCGRIDDAKRMVEKSVVTLSEWEDKNFVNDGGKDMFLDYLAGIPECPEKLREIREEQIKILKVDKLPDYGLDCE